MKIKLLCNIPVDKKHGLVEGLTVEVIEYQKSVYKKRGMRGYWVMGKTKERVKILPHECIVVEE